MPPCLAEVLLQMMDMRQRDKETVLTGIWERHDPNSGNLIPKDSTDVSSAVCALGFTVTFLRFILYLSVWLFCLHVRLCNMCVPGVLKGQKKV